MSARVFVFPLVLRPAFHDLAWREQYGRECAALCGHLLTPPHRTRPLLAVDNVAARRNDAFARVLQGVADALQQEA